MKKEKRRGGFSDSDDEFLPALPEDVQTTLNLSYIPQASVDKRHGGRHLRHEGKGQKDGKFGGRGGKKHGGRHNGGKDHHRRGGRHNGGHQGHHGGKKGGHMKWCMAAGALMFATLAVTFLGIFKKFINAFRSYH